MNVAGKPKPVKLYLKGSTVYPLSKEELCQYSSCRNHLHYQLMARTNRHECPISRLLP
jgi:hypothetical protein